MKKLFLLIGLFSILFACRNRREEGVTNSEAGIVEKNKVKKNEDGLRINQYIQNDSLTQSWITELTKISKNKNKFQIENELRPNRHWDYMDTVKTITFDKSRMTVVSNKGFYGLWTAEICNREIPLTNNIKIGIEKGDLEKIVGIKILNDTVELGNLERTSIFEFNFDNQKLKRIYVIGYED